MEDKLQQFKIMNSNLSKHGTDCGKRVLCSDVVLWANPANATKLHLKFTHAVYAVCCGLSSGSFLLPCAVWCGVSACMTLAPLWHRQTLSAHSLGHD